MSVNFSYKSIRPGAHVEMPLLTYRDIVVEESTGEPLIGALIKIKGLEKEYYTDFEGRFSINELIPGRYDIEVSFISFESTELTEIQLDHQKNDLFVGLR